MPTMIRVQKFFTGVRDGEHYPRSFLEGMCCELADDGGDPARPVPRSLLDVVLTEKWAVVTTKGTVVEPDLAVEMSPAAQRQLADLEAEAAQRNHVEAVEQAERDAAAAEAVRLEAEKKAKADIEAEAAQRAKNLPAALAAKAEADKDKT